LSAVEWDVLAQYVRAGADEERRRSPTGTVPSRESYLALLDAFEAIYVNRVEPVSRYAWAYFGNLDGYHTPVPLSDTDNDQRHQALLGQIARQRAALQVDERWRAPGHVGRCLSVAILEEGVDSTELDHILAPYWPTLWGVAARGHWTRYRRPIRAAGTAVPGRLGLDEDHFPRLTVGEFSLSFMRVAGPEFATTLHVGRTRRVTIQITHYPELVELHAMLERSEPAWTGTYFRASVRFALESCGQRLVVNHAHRMAQFFLQFRAELIVVSLRVAFHARARKGQRQGIHDDHYNRVRSDFLSQNRGCFRFLGRPSAAGNEKHDQGNQRDSNRDKDGVLSLEPTFR
jgi:hypothetical protein